MFCTCSRIWSISTFSSTAALLVRASTDLEPSVLASRLNSCSRKSRRRPTGSFWRNTRRISSTWLDRRSSSSSTSSFCSDSTSSCSTRAGSAPWASSARRACSLLRCPSRISGTRPRTSPAMRSMPSTRSRIAATSLPPSRSRAATNSASTLSSRASACACSSAGSAACDCSTPGNCSSSTSPTRSSGKLPRSPAASSPSRATSVWSTCRDTADSLERKRRVRSTLPRETRVETRSRSAGSSARSSSGRRAPSSRKRWLTARSSQPSVPHGVVRSPEA